MQTTLFGDKTEKAKGATLFGDAAESSVPQDEQPLIRRPEGTRGVFDNPNKQLDALLGDGDLDDFMPFDAKFDFGRIIKMTESPGDTEDKIKLSMFYKSIADIDPKISFNMMDELNKIAVGKPSKPKEALQYFSDKHFESRRQYYRDNLKPLSLFGNAFLQSLASKPALAIKGTQVYTPGKALGFDWFLGKTSEYLENLRSREKMTDVEAAATGKLWPIESGTPWYKIDLKLLPETINTWSATVGDQIPIMLMTLTGRAIGKVAGKPAGTGIGALYALITGGPEPTDVVTAPIIAKVTEKVVEHLSGAAPLIAMEAGGFMDRANAIGLDNDIAEKYARPYGLGSGAIEYSQWLWNMKAFKMLSPKVKMSIMKKVLAEIGGAIWEGVEELSQQGLENFLIGKAIEEQKLRTPEYNVEKPETWAGGKRAFGIGLGVSLITRAPGHAYTTIRSRKLARQIQEQTDATKEEADIAVEAMAESGRVGQEISKVITEQKAKKEAEKEAVTEIKAPEPDVIKDVAEKFDISEERAKAILDRQTELQRQKAEKPPSKPVSERTVPEGEIVKPEAVEAPVTEQDISEEIDKGVRFGVQPSKDGKTFAVIDWETQQEIETTKGERHAVSLARQYNIGTLEPPITKKAALLPSEKETFTIRQTLNYVMKGLSKGARKGYMQGARDILGIHKDIARYANQKLKGLDITKGQRRKLTAAIVNAKTDAQKTAALATVNILSEQAGQAKAIKALKKTVGYINRKIGVVMQKKGIREEFYNKIKALTDTFLMKPQSAKQQRAVRSLKLHLENMQKNTSGKYESQYETEIIPDSLIKRLDKIGAVPVQKMTAEEIENLNDTLKLLIHLNNTKNRLIQNRIARDLAKVLDGAVKELENVNDISPKAVDVPATEQEISKSGAMRSFVTTVAGAKNHDIETLVDTLSGGQKGQAQQIFVEGITEGRENVYRYANQVRDDFKATMKKAGIELKDLQEMSKAFLRILKGKRGMSMRRFLGEFFGSELTPKLHTIKIADKEQQFTMGELMMVYMHAQADFNLKALVEQGAATWRKRLGKMTPAEVEAAVDIVEKDPKAKAMVDMAARVYATTSKEAINKTSTSLIGISLAKEDNYAHVERYKTGGVGGAQRYRLSDLEQEGRLQSREGSREPIIIRDFFEVFFNDMQAISEYVGMAEPLRNARNLINYKAYRNGLRDKGYADQLSYLDKMLLNVQSLPEGGDAIDAIASYFMRGTIRAVLAEPGIFLGQYTSLNGVFNEVSRKYTSAVRAKATEKNKARYKEHFPSYKARIEGGVSSVTLSYLAQNDAALRAFTGKADYMSTFTRLIHEIDALAVTDICRITEAEMQDANRQGRSKDYWQDRGIEPSQLKVDSQEYWDAFVKRAGYIIRRTQPMFTPESRSIFTANKSAAKRMWFLFRSYVDQPLRMAQRSLTAYKHGKISAGQLSKDLGNIWATLALYTIVRFGVAATLYRRDDDWKDLLLDITLAPVRMLALIGFPAQMIIEQAFKATRAPEISTVPIGFADKMLESITWLSKGAGHLVTGEKYKSGPNRGKLKGPIEIERGMILLLENTLMFYGVPEDVPRKIYKGWTKKQDNKSDFGGIAD